MKLAALSLPLAVFLSFALFPIGGQAVDIDGRAQAWMALQASAVLVSGKDAYCGGTLVAPDLVVTAFHCVRSQDTGHKVKVYPGTGAPVLATVVRFENGWDVALLKTATPLLGRVALLAPDVVVGETVLVVGAPDGEEFLVTRGIVSKIAAAGAFSNCRAADRLGTEPHQIIYTDAMVFSGNSGGGMFNTSGNLVGVIVRMAVLDTADCGSPDRAFVPHVLWGYAVGPEMLRKLLNH